MDIYYSEFDWRMLLDHKKRIARMLSFIFLSKVSSRIKLVLYFRLLSFSIDHQSEIRRSWVHVKVNKHLNKNKLV